MSCEALTMVPAIKSEVEADFVVSEAEVAVRLTVYGVGTLAGAE